LVHPETLTGYVRSVNGDLTARDIAYIRASFVPLEDLCRARGTDADAALALIAARQLPQPSYRLPDGTEMVPTDYFAVVDDAGGHDRLRDHFRDRYLAARGRAAELDDDWQAYLDGLYGVCLNSVTPENIVRKSKLVGAIELLLADAKPTDARWLEELRAAVDGLDQLERQFSPDFDRGPRFPRLPSRDRLIAESRRRFPAIVPNATVAPTRM